MLRRLARTSRDGPDIEVGVGIPVGCLVPLAIAVVILVGAGVIVGTRLSQSTTPTAPQGVVVRVIDDGAQGGPAVLSTQVVPLR